ncbi:MAG: glycosyltransferase [Methylocystis sp.]
MTRGLVVFGEDWGGHPSSTQHIVRRLARDRDVVWVNSMGLRRPRVDLKDMKRVFNKMSGFLSPRSNGIARASPPPRMAVIEPRAVSWPGSRVAAVINRSLVGRQLRVELDKREIRKPILWASLPSVASVLGEIGESAVVYYCGDDFGALAGVDHEPVRAMERVLVERADLILSASDELAAKFPPRKTVLIPHGVDFELFSRATERAADLPVGKPIAGFYGAIAEWIDVEMLAAAARRLPDWNFVLIGPIQVDASALRRLPNIHMLGPRAHGALPSYSQHWDVSLLPFRRSPQIQACNPLKLREYLAAGAPIASIDFPALIPYREHVSVAKNADLFADAIIRAASERASMASLRLRVADESWDVRAKTVSRLLESL